MMKLQQWYEVFQVLLFLLMVDYIATVSASEHSFHTAASNLEPSCADASPISGSPTSAPTAGGSTSERAPCTATNTIERDRSDGKRQRDDELQPAFCQRLRPEEGGEPVEGSAPVGHWPWMVLFGRQKVAGQLQFNVPPPTDTEAGLLSGAFCGGVLVDWGFVLTAAHCLSGDLGVNEDGAVAVLLGDRATPLPNGTYAGTVRRVSHVLSHPTADVALALLDVLYQGVPRWVRPACPPPSGAPVPLGLDVEVAGWSPRQLREAALRVSDTAECEAVYSDTPLFEWSFPGGQSGAAVCAVPRGNGGSEAARQEAAWCGSHGGWPLLTGRYDGLYEVVGVSTAGAGCGDPDLPSVFTRVSTYMDWISESLTPAGGPFSECGPGSSDRGQRAERDYRPQHAAHRPEGRQRDHAHDHLQDLEYYLEAEHGPEHKHRTEHQHDQKRNDDHESEYDLGPIIEHALKEEINWRADEHDHEHAIEGEIIIEPNRKPEPGYELEPEPGYGPVPEQEREPKLYPTPEMEQSGHEPELELWHKPAQEHDHE